MTVVGILGGGQLARMTLQAATTLGLEVAVFEREVDSPAGRLTKHEISGPWESPALRRRFAALCDVITLESEFVDPLMLRALARLGTPVRPGAKTLAIVGDKFSQKEHLASGGALPVASFRAVTSPSDVEQVAAEWGWPVVLKARRLAYDGYGNALLRGPEDVESAWARLRAPDRAVYVEAFVRFRHELAVMVARSTSGEMVTYPVVETVQGESAQICRVVRAPAQIGVATAARAIELARRATEAIDAVGVVGVELFETCDGELLLNELAPRPHNSGHYTIEGCVTSQFENHLRAILGLPLGDPSLVAPAAVMVNVLGERAGRADSADLSSALAVPGAHVHIYGKRHSRPGRKMGHVTALGASLDDAEAIAGRAAAACRF